MGFFGITLGDVIFETSRETDSIISETSSIDWFDLSCLVLILSGD